VMFSYKVQRGSALSLRMSLSGSHSFSLRKSFRIGEESKLFCPIDETQNCSRRHSDKM
jgi:hypothetical protein